MKKLLWLFVAVAIFGLLLCTVGTCENVADRDLTLMVYMCGSDLESWSGAASMDIREMQKAFQGNDRISVLVMTGGSKTLWNSSHFQKDAIQIYEITSDGDRCVWRSKELLNMGNPETLTTFLAFGREHYPAENYALIAWDHGSGPLGGVCDDELFDMDNLTLPELQKALKDARFPEKLSWIGFDACMMCSLEVAEAIAPYAHYMIASQETEPGNGWDYSFIRDLEVDTNGLETGKRVIDAYFQSQKNYRGTLTMACVDLDHIIALNTALDDFFLPIARSMDTQDFSYLSDIRKMTTSFGKGLYGSYVVSSDLVDLADLIERLDGSDSDAMRALKETVVYSRSNTKNVNGLSVYHPYMNKYEYILSWKEDYGLLDVSSGYYRYIEKFGDFLTGISSVDWADLYTGCSDVSSSEPSSFSLELTSEQQADFVSAQIYIMRDPYNSNIQLENGYITKSGQALSLIASENAVLGEDGILRAEFQNRFLYVVNEEEQIMVGPVNYFVNDDDPDIYISTEYVNESGNPGIQSDIYVIYRCRPAEDGNCDIIDTYVYDPDSEMMSNRLAFSGESYSHMYFLDMPKELPNTMLAIPGFFSWDSYGGFAAKKIDLSEKWHFRMLDNRQAGDLYAMFQIADKRQNIYSSIPLKISRGEEQSILTPDVIETDEIRLRLSMKILENDSVPSLTLDVECVNKTDQEIRIELRNFILNKEVSLASEYNDALVSFFLDPKEERTDRIVIESVNLAGFQDITRMDAMLDVKPGIDATGIDEKSIPVKILVDHLDVSEIAPHKLPAIGEYACDGITWQVLSLEENMDGSIDCLLYIRNEGEELLSGNFCELYLNGMLMEDYLSFSVSPHTGYYLPVRADNKLILNSYSLKDSGGFFSTLAVINNLLERHGIHAVDQVDLVWNTQKIHIPLQEHAALNEENYDEPELLTLLSLDGLSINTEGVIAAGNGVAAILHIQNDSDETICISCPTILLNGQEPRYNDLRNEMNIIAGTQRLIMLPVCLPEAPDKNELLDLKFEFRIWNRSCPVTVAFPENSRTGTETANWFQLNSLAVTGTDTGESFYVLPDSVRMASGAGTDIRALTVPLSAEECERVNFVSATICTMQFTNCDTWEGGSIKCIASVPIVDLYLEKDPEGNYSTLFPDLILTVNDVPIPVSEYPILDNKWNISSHLYLYEHTFDYLSDSDKILKSIGGYSWTAEININTSLASGNAQIVSFQTYLSNPEGTTPIEEMNRNIPLADVELAATDSTIYQTPIRRVDVKKSILEKPVTFSIEDSLRMELVPASFLKEPLCIRYLVSFINGLHKTILVDWKTGKMLAIEEW